MISTAATYWISSYKLHVLLDSESDVTHACSVEK